MIRYRRLKTGAGRSTISPVLFFRFAPPTYRKRYDMDAIVQTVMKNTFSDFFSKAMDNALATAKIKI